MKFRQEATKKLGVGLINAQIIIFKGILKQVELGKAGLKTAYALEQLYQYWKETRERMLREPGAEGNRQREIDLVDMARIKELNNSLIRVIVEVKARGKIDSLPIHSWINYLEELKARYKKGLANVDIEAIRKSVSREKLDEVSREINEFTREKESLKNKDNPKT
jgi:hypothetical protein